MSERQIDAFGIGAETARQDAVRAAHAGLDGIWFGEMTGDALDGALLAASAGTGLDLGTAVLGALVRNPMDVAYRVADVARVSDGAQLRLGIGSQARQVVRHQYGGDAKRPLSRLIEFRSALLAIWSAWDAGDAPSFRGEHYRHVYTPTPCIPRVPGHPPKVMLGATGTAGRHAAAVHFDGLITHPCTPFDYLREVIAPEFAASRAGCGERELACLTLMFCAPTPDAERRYLNEMRMRLWFWAAAGVHREAFSFVGLDDLTEAAMRGVRRGNHDGMTMISADMIRRFCHIGDAESLVRQVDSLPGEVTRVTIVLDQAMPETAQQELVAELRRRR